MSANWGAGVAYTNNHKVYLPFLLGTSHGSSVPVARSIQRHEQRQSVGSGVGLSFVDFPTIEHSACFGSGRWYGMRLRITHFLTSFGGAR